MPPLWKLDHTTPRLSVPFVPGKHEVVIVGAGITGLATGVMLATLGRDVVIVEAGEIAQLATGSNTGKVSLLQGSTLSTLRRHHPASLVRAYVDANRAGAEWLVGFARDAGLRIDHFLLSPALADRLVSGDVDREARSWEKASDHAATWIVLND